MDTPIWRHRRIWINPKSLNSLQCQGPMSLAAENYMRDWVISGNPLVGRSRLPCDPLRNEALPVGLMVYLQDGTKQRLNLLAQPDFVYKVDEPLLLSDILCILSQPLRLAAVKLITFFEDDAVALRVYGSAFWSYEGKNNRMNTQSDIDLLIQIKKSSDVHRIAKKCLAFSKDSGVSLDGEIEFPNGESVSWREFASGAEDLLVKTDIGPKLITKDLVLEAFNASE